MPKLTSPQDHSSPVPSYLEEPPPQLLPTKPVPDSRNFETPASIPANEEPQPEPATRSYER